jgi:UDP-N-acetyl-D-glucosamine/UDP-N-acetyl-D-galactosamine dehydrogenase
MPRVERIGIVGLGYVGLPVAIEFARHFEDTVGFDIDGDKVDELRRGHDRTGEIERAELQASSLRLTSSVEGLADRTIHVVAVPTPVDRHNRPDFSALVAASRSVGSILRKGAVVVYESTVYPGATEEICAPALEQASGLRAGVDFSVAYSPERINPGDREHTLPKITKVVSGQGAETLERVAAVYERIIPAGIHRAPSIMVAEAAKVIENTQRDLNIALMNELALICGRLGIRTADVLAAAGTKWNFLPFTPGLVGGHCIGVDPYYLTTKAEQLGYQPEVILAGRRINNRMGEHIATTLVKMLIAADVRVSKARVGVLGLTFKENVSDLRNSRVPDIVATLGEYGIGALVHDPLASPDEAQAEYGIALHPIDDLVELDGLVLAVPHAAYLEEPREWLVGRIRDGGVLMDVRSMIASGSLSSGIRYWSL